MRVRCNWSPKFKAWSVTCLDSFMPSHGKVVAYATRALLRDAHLGTKGMIGLLDGWQGEATHEGRRVWCFDMSVFGRQDVAYERYAKANGTLIIPEVRGYHLEMAYLGAAGVARGFDPCLMPEGTVPEDN